MDDAALATRALKRARELHPLKIDLSLERIQGLLDKLENPENSLPPVIHVAGTNGKGSTCAVMRAVLEAAGHRAHVYTSPHLVHFRERIRIAGKLIPDKVLAEILGVCEEANGGGEITFFEFTTAAAFLAFSRQPADVSIIEVGLGGRYDATNVIREPAVSVISPIHVDHEAFLGESLAGIAAEKAGILRSGTPGVVGPQLKPASEKIEEIAAEVGAPLSNYNQEWSARPSARNPERMDYYDRGDRFDLPLPSLPGVHQIANAGLALTALRHLPGFELPPAALRAGLDWVHWPGRMQQIVENAALQLLPEGSEFWIDGAHNPQSARAAAKFIVDRLEMDRPFYLIFAALQTKDVAGIVAPFRRLTEEIFTVSIPGAESAYSAGALAAEASAAGFRGRPAGDALSALQQIGEEAGDGDPPVVLAVGSLYLAGWILKRLNYVPR